MIRDGTVLWGANNIFRVVPDGSAENDEPVEARIRGKVLSTAEGEYNALAPGDRVIMETSGTSTLITERLERSNQVMRWNRKRRQVQTVAANVDLLAVVSSYREPPIRPRFVDRVLAMADLEGITPLVIFNKRDLAAETLDPYEGVLTDIGIDTIGCSARTRWNLDVLHASLAGKSTVLFGQSGVGKSSLVNALFPGSDQAVGTVSTRYNRGRHTTTLARRIIVESGTVVVDTPGVREFDLFMYDTVEIAAGFREFRPHIPACAMPSCTHIHEPGCAVRSAVDSGQIDPVRHQSYVRIAADLGEWR